MGGGDKVSLLLTVALLGVTVLCNPTDINVNETETEGEFLEDALGNWLGNFGTYTFMVEQDVDDTDDEVAEEELVPEEPTVFEDKEDEDDDYDQGSAAPITLSIKKTGGLLNPEIDYKVKLESLVAEGGSVLVTLGSFKTKTSCGVGGFSLPPEFEGRGGGPEGHLNINHQRDGIRSTTVVAFAVDTEEEETTTTWTVGDEGSTWEELSQNLWWATGKLVGGGLLTLIFTPPECGCLMLRAYYALPLGDNLTLVVGPEAYPMDLETLLCVDPASSHSIQENLIEPEVEEEGVTQDGLEEPTHLQETDNDLDSSDGSIQIGRGRGRGRWAARKARRDRKKKRQEARQAIRQAGRRVTRQRIRKHMRLQRKEDGTGDNLENRQDSPHNSRQGGKWARKKARKAARKQKQAKKTWKGKKPWKKHRKHARKNSHRNKHNRRNRHNRNQNISEEVTPHPTEAFEDHLEEDEDHFNSTEPQTDEDAVADILLAEEEEEEPEAGDNTVGSGDAPTRRQGRKHQKQRGRAKNKWRNKEKRKAVKFCCKQGIKFKRSQLPINNTVVEDQPILCSDTNDIIITFAEHRFGIESAQCASRFETCCSKFTLQVWENMKAKKAARKAKRKQQRKTRRQQKRKQLRQQ